MQNTKPNLPPRSGFVTTAGLAKISRPYFDKIFESGLIKAIESFSKNDLEEFERWESYLGYKWKWYLCLEEHHYSEFEKDCLLHRNAILAILRKYQPK